MTGTAIQVPDTRLSRREATRKYAVNNCGETYTEWNYDTKGGDNACHKSILLTPTPMYRNEWRIN
jgi:hypothetical protein